MCNGRAKATPFPIVVSNGCYEMKFGIVAIAPSMNFKRLLFLLSEHTGISPYFFSIFLADKTTDQKSPLTAEVDLSASSLHSGEFYLFVKKDGYPFSCLEPAIVIDPPILDSFEVERRMMERDIVMRSLEMYVESLIVDKFYDDNSAVCDECLKAKLAGIDADFHLCARDQFLDRLYM